MWKIINFSYVIVFLFIHVFKFKIKTKGKFENLKNIEYLKIWKHRKF